MNMFKAVKAKTAKAYFAALPAERREQMLFLDRLIRKTAPKLKPSFSYNMPGYGKFPYKNYKGQHLMWPTIAIASQKNYISVYVCAVHKGKYVAETNKKNLGKVSVGKSCIRFKKIEDINLDVLKKVIKLAEKHPGLTGIGKTSEDKK